MKTIVTMDKIILFVLVVSTIAEFACAIIFKAHWHYVTGVMGAILSWAFNHERKEYLKGK